MKLLLRFLVILMFVLLLSDSAASQSRSSHTWIFFKDRGSSAVDNKSLSPSALGISQRVLWRRAKVLPPNKLIDERDLPVAAEYISTIRATGASIRATSRWFNAVSVEATPAQLQACQQLPFVLNTQPVAVSYRRMPEASSVPILQKSSTTASLDYGPSLTQVENINAVNVHNLGINGAGIIVGMVDDGYNNHRVHEAMKDIRVLAEYDFVHDDTNTSFEGNDNPGQGGHGALTLSTLAGYKEGQLIGPAYGALLLLAKTEVVPTETQIEEDYYVEGLEWLDSLGADIISSSLGYIDWYDYDSLDGQTAITTKAARILAQRGILLVTAMGNEGLLRTGNPDSTGTLIAPADADSIIAVGAVTSNNIIANFSSTGPTFDGRIKPEVVAQGVSVWSANGGTISSYSTVNGTSLSTPLTAGAAALVLSAHPELTPMQVREALIATALQVEDGTNRTSSWPNNYYGWGKIDALAAVLYHGLVFSNKPFVTQSGDSLVVTIAIAPNPSALLVSDSLFLYYRPESATEFQRVALSTTGQPNTYSASITMGVDSVFEGYFSARDNSGSVRTHPHDAPNSLLALDPDSNQTGIPGNPAVPARFVLYNNYPNPFNGETIIRFDAPQAVEVELAIYNILGQRVRTLFKGIATQGMNQLSWDGSADGGPAASGVYFSRLTTPTTTLTGKMVYIR